MTTERYKSEPKIILERAVKYSATIKTDQGSLVFDLLTREAPRTVNSFVFLAREGFYKDSTFHRVVKGVLIQGGCPEGNGSGGPGYHVQDEEVNRPYTKGTLAMARRGRNENGSQFFIVLGERVGFPPNFTIFGRLITGADHLKDLGEVAVDEDLRGEKSRPTTPLVIEDIESTTG